MRGRESDPSSSSRDQGSKTKPTSRHLAAWLVDLSIVAAATSAQAGDGYQRNLVI